MTSTAPTESRHPKTFILYEGSGDFSRETMVVAPNQALVAGQVVAMTIGRESGLAEVTAFDPNGTDGSQIAAGIMVYPASSNSSIKATVLVRRAELRESDLTWPVKISDAQRAAAVNELKAAGILVK